MKCKNCEHEIIEIEKTKKYLHYYKGQLTLFCKNKKCNCNKPEKKGVVKNDKKKYCENCNCPIEELNPINQKVYKKKYQHLFHWKKPDTCACGCKKVVY